MCHAGATSGDGATEDWQTTCTVVSVRNNWTIGEIVMLMLAAAPPVLAAGWSLLYLLFGGGLGGAVLIFIVLKLIGR